MGKCMSSDLNMVTQFFHLHALNRNSYSLTFFRHTLNSMHLDDLRVCHVGEIWSAGKPQCCVPSLGYFI